MKDFESTINKLKKVGFLILQSGNEEEKDNILLYKSNGNNLDLIVAKNENIVSFLTLKTSEIVSFKVVDRYINITMKNETVHRLEEISYDSLDQMLLFILVEKKTSSRVLNTAVNL